MASCRNTYKADFFKKDKRRSVAKSCDRNSALDRKNEKNCSEGRTLSSENESFDEDECFPNEDRVIAKLYRSIVDDMIVDNNLQEWKVNTAISKMKEDIHQAHKNGFRKFCGIDFCKATNRCGYLRRYAICHTGLVKKAIWRFLYKKSNSYNNAKDGILTSNHLKVVSLGGGPGNDLIGFCSALQETNNSIKELDLKIVDISQGWVSVLSAILKKAKNSNSGSLSELLKKTKITTSFVQADLSSDKIFDDETLTSILSEADIVLMVKVVSFIPDHEAVEIIQNVVDAMQVGALLIFIDQPYDAELFWRISSLDQIYHHYLKYELSFNPARYHLPAIDSSQAHIGVFEKEFESSSEDDMSDNDES